jgi:hypothetical protein
MKFFETTLCDGEISALLCLCLLFFLGSLLPLAAHADGGAPNLAYVSGTASGVSVIDIAQQRISRTLALDSEPQTILLSLDGSFLLRLMTNYSSFVMAFYCPFCLSPTGSKMNHTRTLVLIPLLL